VRAM